MCSSDLTTALAALFSYLSTPTPVSSSNVFLHSLSPSSADCFQRGSASAGIRVSVADSWMASAGADVMGESCRLAQKLPVHWQGRTHETQLNFTLLSSVIPQCLEGGG